LASDVKILAYEDNIGKIVVNVYQAASLLRDRFRMQKQGIAGRSKIH
jgi:hypothetical protein